MPEIHIINATRELGIIRFLKDYIPPFEVIGTYRLIDDGERPEATVMLRAGKQEMHEADIGVGPVDALATVLKKSLGRLFGLAGLAASGFLSPPYSGRHRDIGPGRGSHRFLRRKLCLAGFVNQRQYQQGFLQGPARRI